MTPACGPYQVSHSVEGEMVCEHRSATRALEEMEDMLCIRRHKRAKKPCCEVTAEICGIIICTAHTDDDTSIFSSDTETLCGEAQ